MGDVQWKFGYNTQWHTLLVCCCSYRVQRKVVSLSVYKDGDWLQLSAWRYRYDSINTLVMCFATTAFPIPVGDHEVLTSLRYPVHSSQYYKQRSVWKFVPMWTVRKLWTLTLLLIVNLFVFKVYYWLLCGIGYIMQIQWTIEQTFSDYVPVHHWPSALCTDQLRLLCN